MTTPTIVNKTFDDIKITVSIWPDGDLQITIETVGLRSFEDNNLRRITAHNIDDREMWAIAELFSKYHDNVLEVFDLCYKKLCGE